MKKLNGVETALHIRRFNTVCNIVFVSSFDNPYEFISVSPLQIIHKPANKQMFQYFQLIPCEVEGLLFGCAFHCVYLETGSKCGHHAKCESCDIRSAVQDILCNRIAIRESVIQYSFVSKNRRRMKWFQMNGMAIENGHEQCVALTFTDITELKNQEEYL